jgi:hypothetical protein
VLKKDENKDCFIQPSATYKLLNKTSNPTIVNILDDKFKKLRFNK